MGKHPPLQDDITLVLQTQKTVVHDTVRINVTIQAQVHPDQSESEFRKQIQSTLKQFVDGDWKIQNMQRSKGNQFESVTVQAVVRVSEKEDHQLETRAAKVSKIGFELTSPFSEYELTFDEIQEINSQLRLSLVNKALSECKHFNEAFKHHGYRSFYRIASTRFDNGNVTNTGNRNAGFATAMMAAVAASPLGGSAQNNAYQSELTDSNSSDSPVDMGVSTRFSMTGTFVLRADHECK